MHPKSNFVTVTKMVGKKPAINELYAPVFGSFRAFGVPADANLTSRPILTDQGHLLGLRQSLRVFVIYRAVTDVRQPPGQIGIGINKVEAGCRFVESDVPNKLFVVLAD